MPNPVFPANLAGEQDSKFFSVTQSESTVKGEIEGGYKHTRPRTTRKPRKTFETGFTEITDALLDELTDFYDTVGTHTIFDWTHPIKGTTHAVRFTAPFKAKYVGSGGNHLFDVQNIGLEEA